MISFTITNPKVGLPSDKTTTVLLTNSFNSGATVKVFWFNSLIGTGLFNGTLWNISTFGDIPVEALPTNAVVNNTDKRDIPSTTLANLGSAQSAGDGVRYTLEDANLASVESNNGLWLSKRRAVFVKAGSKDYAAFNTSQIQTALNLGGIVELVSGVPDSVVYVDNSVNTQACLVLPSFSKLIAPNDMTITQTDNIACGLVITKSMLDYYNNNISTVTLTWTSGSSFNVNHASHGLAVGDHISLFKSSISNTDPIQLANTYRIDAVVDSNNYTCNLYRAINTAPVNTTKWKVIKSTVGASLIGGKWDYNFRNNPISVQNTHTMCMIFAFTAYCYVDPYGFYDTKKYCIMSACDLNSYIKTVRGITANSDGLKIYGPSKGLTVDNIVGKFGDDCVSLQAYEAPGYQGYMVSFGDVLDITVNRIDATSTTATAVVYTDAIARTDNIKFGTISGNQKVSIIGQASKVGNIGFVDFGIIDSRVCSQVFIAANCAAETIKYKIIAKPMSNPLLTSIGTTVSIQSLEITTIGGDMSYNTVTTCHLINGDIGTLTFKGDVVGLQGTTRFADLPTSTSGSVKYVVLDLNAKGFDWILRYNTGTQTYTPVITISGVYDNVNSVFNSYSTTNQPKVRTDKLFLNNVSSGAVKAATGGTIQFKDNGDTYLGGTSILSNANGGTIAAWS